MNETPRSGSPHICIAVLDGPIDLDHPCFLGANIATPLGAGFVDTASKAAAHGTHVASIIFGQPGSPAPGLAPDCRGVSVPIFADAGEGGLACTQVELARAILIAVENGAHVINISGGQLAGDREPEPLLLDALRKCEDAQVLVVAAAGNDGCDCAHIPALVPTVLAVGACDRDGEPLGISNWGAPYRANGVLALGQAIAGAQAGGGVIERSGTSFATPIVSAVAGLMLSDQYASGGAIRPLDIRDRLISGAIACTPKEGKEHDRCLAGRLDVRRLLQTFKRGEFTMDSSHALHDHETQQAQPSSQPGWARAPSGHQHSAVTASSEDTLSTATPERGGITTSDCACGGGGAAKDCGCGCGGAKKATQSAPQLVYALGQIGYDFGTEARRDSIRQFIEANGPFDDDMLIKHLRRGANDVDTDAERVIWTLNLDQTPIYAIRPGGAFAFDAYAKLVTALNLQMSNRKNGKTSLHAVGGMVAGTIRLMSGETVPVIVPSAKGITPWDIKEVVEELILGSERKPARDASDEEKEAYESRMEGLRRRYTPFLNDFCNMITRRYRNLGLLGRERALNYAATSAFRVVEILKRFDPELLIDDISVINSPACRSGSECYDVLLTLFRPSDTTDALHQYQFTVDVSDTIPVNIGEVADWRERPRN